MAPQDSIMVGSLATASTLRLIKWWQHRHRYLGRGSAAVTYPHAPLSETSVPTFNSTFLSPGFSLRCGEWQHFSPDGRTVSTDGHCSGSHSARPSAICLGHSSSQQEVESISPSLDHVWPCNLLWLIHCGRSDTGWLPGLSRGGFTVSVLALLESSPMEKKFGLFCLRGPAGRKILEDEMPCGRE